MANLNKVLLIGRLTRDPELRYTPSGTAVSDLGLAVNNYRKGQDGQRQEETVFVDVTAWGRTAELANQYLAKGRQVFVEGRLKFDQWTSQEGQKRSKLNVVAENLQFLDSRGEGGPPGGGGGGRSHQGSPSYSDHQGDSGGGAPRDDYQQPSNDFDGPSSGDEDIPF
ncbi:Single-stranded DNA-binding protein [Planctomycetes bacterium Pan216]|uniref:Single-stranded DNA-binding protein n=1 Tax=Kolteria novifilia TaxID=2527975 RepID=A0A518B9U6_9BACT|nr:Single-stranded DNA-binding protein [Planctomycetes bacterium Pan216]